MWKQSLAPHLGSAVQPVSSQEGLTHRSSLEQSFLWQCPRGFLAPTVQNLWRKTLDMRFEKGANKCLLLGNSHFCPQLSMALLSLAQSNQCADYCTTALSWTGSLNTGRRQTGSQKLPTMHLKSSPGLGEKPPFLHQGLPWLPLNSAPTETQGLWFPVLTWHICCRLGGNVNLGPGRRAGAGSPYMGWCHPGEFGYALCRWVRWNRLLSDMGLCIKWYQMFSVMLSSHFIFRPDFFLNWAGSGPQYGKAVKKKKRERESGMYSSAGPTESELV